MTTYIIKPVRCKLVRDGSTLRAPVDKILSFSDAGLLFRWYYRRESLPHERVVAALLNNGGKIIGIVRVAEGGLHGCALTPSDVLRPAIVAGAGAFVLAHNHPSEDPNPSPEDLKLTRTIKEAADICGPPLLDHLVITNDQATSLIDLI